MPFVSPLPLLAALSMAGASLRGEAPPTRPPKALTAFAALQRLFADPLVEYRVLPVLRTNDDVDPEELHRQIRSMKEQGCGGTFSYIERFQGGMPQRFLSDAWWQIVRSAAEACVKEGLQYCAYDEEDWPSGAAGRPHARAACKRPPRPRNAQGDGKRVVPLSVREFRSFPAP